MNIYVLYLWLDDAMLVEWSEAYSLSREMLWVYIWFVFFFIWHFFLERRRRTTLHYIKKRKGKILKNTKQHKDTTQHQTHTGTHILALTHPPTGILKQSRLLTRIERKNDHQRPSFHSTNVEAVRKEIPRAPAIDHNFLSSLDRIRARATSGAAPSKTQLFR